MLLHSILESFRSFLQLFASTLFSIGLFEFSSFLIGRICTFWGTRVAAVYAETWLQVGLHQITSEQPTDLNWKLFVLSVSVYVLFVLQYVIKTCRTKLGKTMKNLSQDVTSFLPNTLTCWGLRSPRHMASVTKKITTCVANVLERWKKMKKNIKIRICYEYAMITWITLRWIEKCCHSEVFWCGIQSKINWSRSRALLSATCIFFEQVLATESTESPARIS